MLPILLVSPLLFIVFGGTVYGAIWAMNISSAITRERETGAHALLCATPYGVIGTHWAICAGYLHRGHALQRTRSEWTRVIRVLLIIVLLGGISVLVVPSPSSQRESIIIIVGLILLIFTTYIDYVQSVIFSGITGMLTASFVHQRTDARFFSMSLFCLLQIFSYLLVWVGGFVLLPALYHKLMLTGWYAEVSLLFLRVALFYGIRELMITGIWRILIQRLDTDDAEFAALTQIDKKQDTGDFDNVEIVARFNKPLI